MFRRSGLKLDDLRFKILNFKINSLGLKTFGIPTTRHGKRHGKLVTATIRHILLTCYETICHMLEVYYEKMCHICHIEITYNICQRMDTSTMN
jgi:hypothetical protein